MDGEATLRELQDRVIKLEWEHEHLVKALDSSNHTHDRHIHEIRSEARKTQSDTEIKHDRHEVRIRGVEKYLAMGLGGLAVLEVALKFWK